MQKYFLVLVLAFASVNALLMDEEPMDFSRIRRQAETFNAVNSDTKLIPLLSSILPNSEDCVYTNNRQFLGLVLYVRINVASALECGNTHCSSDSRCTHFNYNPSLDGGSCTLCSQPGSGGTWSVPTPPASQIVCGHIPKRSCNPNALLSVCLGLDLGLGLGKK